MAMILFEEIKREVKKSLVYCQESSKVDFAIDLSALMDRKGVSRTQLSRLIGKSPAYVTKVLRGDSNFTIDSMVALVHGLGGALHFKVTDAPSQLKWAFECIDGTKKSAQTVSGSDWAAAESGVAEIKLPIGVKHSDDYAAAA